MKKNILNKYLDDQLFSIAKELNNFRQNKKHESLHAVRVGIKKTKAVLSFAEVAYGKTYPKKELNPLFHKTGNIRELQVVLSLVKKEKLSTAIAGSLTHEITRLEKKFLNQVPRYFTKLSELLDRTLLPAEMPPKKAVLRYFRKQERKAGSELQSKNREGLHCYRRDIKRIMYVHGALPEKWQTEIVLDRAETDRQQEEIGRWHDTWSAVTLLSRRRFSKKAKGVIAKLKEKEKKQFKALLQ